LRLDDAKPKMHVAGDPWPVGHSPRGLLARGAPRRRRSARVRFDLNDYAHVDQGYAATIHNAQGVTVDRALRRAAKDRHVQGAALDIEKESNSILAYSLAARLEARLAK
jgi:hypothetical protein